MSSVAALPGINVLGYHTSNSGIGVATRRVVELLRSRDIPLSLFDVEPSERRATAAVDARMHSPIREAELPHPINLMVLPITVVKTLLDRFESEALRLNRLNVAVCFWELPTIPSRYVAPLEELDVIVATSDYIRHVFQLALSGPSVITGRFPCDIPPEVGPDRPRFNIPDDSVAFVSSFEPGSDPKRKNPYGVVDAFVQGVGADDRAFLVVRVKNATRDGIEHPVMEELRLRVGSHPRILLVAEELAYNDVLSLYASCDVFVSLHRAEGLGLGMLEAMAMGKAIIATGWSGNMTFMNHTCACIVRYTLVPTDGSIDAYRQDNLEDTTVWAEPDIDHAARWMKYLVEDANARDDFGRRAKERYCDFTAEQPSGGFVSEIAEILRQRRIAEGLARRRPDRTVELLRRNRIARIKQLESELRWIQSRRTVRLGRMLKRLLQLKST